MAVKSPPLFATLLINNTQLPWWLSIMLWIVELVTLSLVLRTFVFPWVLASLSERMRIRSVSFRSIRGLYIRTSARTYRVDRVSYRWTRTHGLSVRLHGLNVEILKLNPSHPPPKFPTHLRSFSRADFAPSPMANHVREVLAYAYYLLEPYFRPLVRTFAVAFIRILIRWLPQLLEGIVFELNSVSLTFSERPDTQINVEKVLFSARVTFTQLANVMDVPQRFSTPRSRNRLRVGAWRSRLTNSFKRTLNRAWGQAQGTAFFSLNLTNIGGSLRIAPDIHVTHFLRLPGTALFKSSLSFNPREGTIESRSLETSLSVGDCLLDWRALSVLLDEVKQSRGSDVFDDDNPAQSMSADYPSPPVPTVHLSSPTTPESRLLSSTSAMSARSDSSFLSSLRISPPLTPSPLFESLSTSIRNRRLPFGHSPVRLRDTKDTSLLSIFRTAKITISEISCSITSAYQETTYHAVVQNLSVSASHCHAACENRLQRISVGKSKAPENYDCGHLHCLLSLQHFILEREADVRSIRMLIIGRTNVRCLLSQWPSPWLQPSPFMSGDPNAQVMTCHITVDFLEVNEHIDHLQSLIATAYPSKRKNQNPPTPSSHVSGFPRLTFDLRCGLVRARLTCREPSEATSLAVELRTNGFTLSAHSNFASQNTSLSVLGFSRLKMNYSLTVAIEPTLLRVCSRKVINTSHPDLCESDAEFLNEPALITMESMEIIGDGAALMDCDEISGNAASLVPYSAVLNLRSSSDAFCLELWHPDAIVVSHRILSLVGAHDPPGHSTAKPLLDKLPLGLTFDLGFGRFAVIATAPDINPEDKMDLSRGLAFRTGLSLHYSSLHSDHLEHIGKVGQRAHARSQLSLPPEVIVDAASVASATDSCGSAHMKVFLSNLSIRSAVATQYEADDPLFTERDNPSLQGQEFLHVPNVTVSSVLSRKRISDSPHLQDECEVVSEISPVNCVFQFGHVYSLLLAFQTLRSMSCAARSRHRSPNPPSPLHLRFRLSVSTVQIMWSLPKQIFATRFDALRVYSDGKTLVHLSMEKMLTWVSVPSRVNRWDADTGNKWRELFAARLLKMSLPKDDPIYIDTDSVRLRIPHGCILAELISDVIVATKALRHLYKIVVAGLYEDMAPPEPEAPKPVRDLLLKVRCLLLEASDDPMESKLNVILRCGPEAAMERLIREKAFLAKVAAIYEDQTNQPIPIPVNSDYHFTGDHTVSIEDARRRLDEVHVADWALRTQYLKDTRTRSEDRIQQNFLGDTLPNDKHSTPNIVEVCPEDNIPPLFRMSFDGLSLEIHPPSFPTAKLPDFLYEHGNGVPRDTQFSLLVPLHLSFTSSSLSVTLRDYPLPLCNVPLSSDPSKPTLEFDTDLVIAEEMGTALSVDWIRCLILAADSGVHGTPPLSLTIPKTIMAVKSYANPVVRVATSETTVFSWGVSYMPAAQDLVRIIETLTPAPRDPSPALGFWDKLRLIFHWRLLMSFKGEVHFHMKGSRNPYYITDAGAGFVLSWSGNTELLVGHKNDDSELVQVISDSMIIAIPNLHHATRYGFRPLQSFAKVCAKLRSGVRFGVGFVLERTCGVECGHCSGSPFQRRCRLFDFKPHYAVKLEKKSITPLSKDADDSFGLFRSDFIHLSISLSSSISRGPQQHFPSSLHLTPKAFTHFWSWCDLFDGALSLPIRQGSCYPQRTISPKFGRHLATIKYRIHLRHLFIMHAYMDESRENWVDGLVPWVGVKGHVEDLQVDMHQRDEETIVQGLLPDTTKLLRRKPFYAAEVVLKGLDLRSLLVTFDDPLRKFVTMTSPPQRSNYRMHTNLPVTYNTSPWYDSDDFVELDWMAPHEPELHLLPTVKCPHFAYFKRNSAALGNPLGISKFGIEKTHTCRLGQEPSLAEVQISLALARIDELQKSSLARKPGKEKESTDHASVRRMVTLLEEYIASLHSWDQSPRPDDAPMPHNYRIPFYSLSADEWVEFENVYQIHCPKVILDDAIRDILVQYYYGSHARKGLEYHLATRAVKFIRDQAEAALESRKKDDEEKANSGVNHPAQMAASAIRKILKGEAKTSFETSADSHIQGLNSVNPLDGWAKGVSLRKSHCCLLLKPQIVLRGETRRDALIVSSDQAKLQSFAIMDNLNVEDPVSGKVMSRNYTSLSGLQTFSPITATAFYDDGVPLEVLIDLRCESGEFDRVVPQTDAIIHYDKFNRLRLRNTVTSVQPPLHPDSSLLHDQHLQNQTDLIRVHIPRFTVSATEGQFQTISQIVTQLLLFSDVAHKTRLDKLETLLFSYDFTDLKSAADVISNLQRRLQDAMETRSRIQNMQAYRLHGENGRLEMLKLQAHIFLLSEELNFLFEAIKLAQDRFDEHGDQKSALLLHTSSTEISWRMLDERRDLLSKIVAQNIDFYWLNRQDGSTGNNLTIGNIQAFDGSRNAIWDEILSKHDEPSNHPLLKRGIFVLASWSVLPPVGGITIYESFELSFHPMRLQIDARVGRRILEYVWPARKHRNASKAEEDKDEDAEVGFTSPRNLAGRSSLDSPRALRDIREPTKAGLTPPLRRLGNSRSFTDLRATKHTLQVPALQRTHSTESLDQISTEAEPRFRLRHRHETKLGNAEEMKTRTSQKSFALVRISSLHLLLSIVKEGSFECRDARIKTRDLEYRNQTWSLEELVNQFIPSDTSWRSWVKIAFHQPLLPVFPVARELLSKTKWISSKAAPQIDLVRPPSRLTPAKALLGKDIDKAGRHELDQNHKGVIQNRSRSPHRRWRPVTTKVAPPTVTQLPLTDEPESLTSDDELQGDSQGRMKRLFSRGITDSRRRRNSSK